MNFTGKFFYVAGLRFEHYRYTYPDVDVEQEFRLMNDWLESNPRRRKKNYDRFITNWLKAEQRKASARHAEARIGTGPRGSVSPAYLAKVRERELLAKKGSK